MVIPNLVTLTIITVTVSPEQLIEPCLGGFSTQSPGFCIGSHESLPWWDPLMQPLAVMSYVFTLLPISECFVLFGGQEAEMGPLCIAVPHLT